MASVAVVVLTTIQGLAGQGLRGTWRGARHARCEARMVPEWALIFDCDGVILESESLHRESYNDVFREFSVDVTWSPEYYDELQNTIGGGIPKMRYHFGKTSWPASKLGPPPVDDDAREDLLVTLQDRKTQLYKDKIGTEATARPNILRIMDAAIADPAVAVAVCSASTKSACLYVLENLLGADRLARLDHVAAGDDVSNRKPDPEIYMVASDKLGVPRERCLVVEDSLIGLQAAVGAGMPCIITTTPSTASQDFSGALAVYGPFPDDLDVATLRSYVIGGGADSSGAASFASANFALSGPTAVARRSMAVGALATGVALGGDLFGVTRGLLSLFPDAARRARLDVIYPVRGFRRFVAADGAYELLRPSEWLADQVLALPRPGDVVPLDTGGLAPRSRRKGRGAALDAAFGPPGGDRTENLSVIRARVSGALDLSALFADPTAAAQSLLASTIAPEGSGKRATLINAARREDGVIQFAYAVEFGPGTALEGQVINNEACVAYLPQSRELLTLTVLAPAAEWADGRSGPMLRAVAPSFRLL